MSQQVVRIGTRESQLAVWQANKVKDLLAQNGHESELVFIKSEGDIDLKTPLYEIGVQGIFTRSLDIALLNNKIDIAVHSLKDVPTQLPQGIIQSAVLERASYKDLLVVREGELEEVNSELGILNSRMSIESKFGQQQNKQPQTPNPKQQITPNTTQFLTIATSSIRRKAQWLNRFPHDMVENLRGNVNTRLQKVKDSNWSGAIFAAAGLERLGLRPANAIELDWMLPAPSQGAISVVCRENDTAVFEACQLFNDAATDLCTKIEKAFLRTLLGGCSTPIGALAVIKNDTVFFRGNIFSTDGKQRVDIEKNTSLKDAANLGETAAKELLANGGKAIADTIQHERK